MLWIEEAYERRRAAWTQVDRLAALLTGGHLVALFAVIGGGSLYIDDLRAQAYALDQPFWQFIVGSNGTHFAPLPRVLDWVQSRVFPLDHAPAVVVTLLIRLLLAVAFWRLLRRLFGPRPAVLVPFAVLLITPALLPATTWYRQAITIVACTVAMVWALDAFVAWIHERKTGSLATVSVATAVAVGCYEKGAAIPVILVAAYIALPAIEEAAGNGPGARNRLRAAGIAIGLSGLVVAAFLAVYRSGPYDQGSAKTPTAVQMLDLAWATTTRTILPMLLGGPWRWYPDTPYAGGFHPGLPVVVAVGSVVVVGLLIALRRSPGRVLRGAVLLVGALVPSVVIVAVGRYDAAGRVLADTARLWADLVPFFVLAGAIALLTRLGEDPVATRRPPPPAQAAQAAGPSTRRSRRDSRDRDRFGGTVPLATIGVAAAVVGLGSAVSTATYAARWWDNPTGAWTSNLRASLAAAGDSPRVLATPLPEGVIPSWVSPELPTAAPLILLLRPDVRFHDGDGSTLFSDPSGRLVAPVSVELARSRGTASCAAQMPAAQDASPWLRLTSDSVYLPGAQVEVGLLMGGPGRVRITVRTPDGTELVPQRFSDDRLGAGAHTVNVPVPLGRAVRSVQVSVDDAADTCITQVRIVVPSAPATEIPAG